MRAPLLAMLLASNTAAATDPAPPAGPITVTRLGPSLAPAGQAAIDPGGAVLGTLEVTTKGELRALVEGRSGALEQVTWGGDGQERRRQPLALTGPVEEVRFLPDGGVLAVAGGVVAELGPDGRARRQVPAPAVPPEEAGRGLVAIWPGGAWFALPGGLVRVGLDGGRLEVASPVDGLPGGPQRSSLAVLALDDGSCLLAQREETRHPVKGTKEGRGDRTVRLLLTRLDPHGAPLAHVGFGAVATSLEWFWSEPGTSQSWGPSDAGLVRTRFRGEAWLHGLALRADGSVVLALVEDGRARLAGLGGDLGPRWSAPRDRFEGGVTLSPPWTRGLLLYAGDNEAVAFDEQGRPVARGVVPAAPGTRWALGQLPDGSWLVIRY